MPRSNVLFDGEGQKKMPPSGTPPENNHREQVYKLIQDVTKTPFSSLISLPQVFKFSDQSFEEKIILVVRQHWYINIKWILPALLMILAPALLTFLPLHALVPARFYFPTIFFWYLITFAFAFEGFLSWWFNVFIITEERIVDIDFLNLLNSKTSDAELDKIQDVSYEIKGLAATFLNFGDLSIQTAGEMPEIELKNAPSPDLIAKVLQTLRMEEKQEALEGRVK